MKKKLRVIALAVAFALIFSGCSLFTVDQQLVEAQKVATVNGSAITRLQVEQATMSSEAFLNEFYYLGVGYEELRNDEDTKEWYIGHLNNTLDQLVEKELLKQKAPELGISLTDEEKNEKREEADSQFEYIKEQLRMEVEEELGVSDAGGDADTDGEEPEDSPAPTDGETETESPAPAVDDAAIEAEVEKRYQEYLAEAELTPDMYYELLCDEFLVDKVADYLKGLADVTDEEVKKWYDDTLAAQQAQMDENPAVFTENMNSNLICTYVPEDTVAVKHVLVKFKDADLAEVAQKLYTDGKKEEAMELLKGEIEALTPSMLEIKQRLEGGESIDDLIDELGEDPGMASGTTAAIGYLVGESVTTYVSEFKDAALKLKSEGQISEPVATYYGLHVMQNIKNYTKGAIPFDELKDNIKAALLPGKQQDKIREMIDLWKSEANITYDRARLEN